MGGWGHRNSGGGSAAGLSRSMAVEQEAGRKGLAMDENARGFSSSKGWKRGRCRRPNLGRRPDTGSRGATVSMSPCPRSGNRPSAGPAARPYRGFHGRLLQNPSARVAPRPPVFKITRLVLNWEGRVPPRPFPREVLHEPHGCGR